MHTDLPVSHMQPIWATTWQNQQSECAPSKDSDQPGHPPSLIRVLLWAQWIAKDQMFLHADSEGSDQTGKMPRLIWVFAGRSLIFGFVMRWRWLISISEFSLWKFWILRKFNVNTILSFGWLWSVLLTNKQEFATVFHLRSGSAVAQW